MSNLTCIHIGIEFNIKLLRRELGNGFVSYYCFPTINHFMTTAPYNILEKTYYEVIFNQKIEHKTLYFKRCIQERGYDLIYQTEMTKGIFNIFKEYLRTYSETEDRKLLWINTN